MISQAIGSHRVGKIAGLLQADRAIDQCFGIGRPQRDDLRKSFGGFAIILDVLQREAKAKPSVRVSPIKCKSLTEAGERPTWIALRGVSLRGAKQCMRRLSRDVDRLSMSGPLGEADGRGFSGAIDVSAQQRQQGLELLGSGMARRCRDNTIGHGLRVGITFLAIDLDRFDESLI